MRFKDSLSILGDMRVAVRFGLWPTLSAILRRPWLLFSPSKCRRIFMAHLWKPFSDGIDENSREIKISLISAHAYGTVLEIGAGYGHTVKYLDRDKVSKYIAVEPNPGMHAGIRAKAEAAGFSEAAGSLLILRCGAEDLGRLLAAVPRGSVDTLVAILTLCSLPASPTPATVLEALVRACLRPGGALLFYEHVLSPRPDVARLQRLWTPVWSALFDGCCLDRPSHLWVKQMQGVWREGEAWGKADEPEEHLFWHQIGRYVKA